MALGDLVLGITGASGAPYALRLLEVLVQTGRTVHVTMSPAAVQVFHAELGVSIDLKATSLVSLLPERLQEAGSRQLRYHHFMNFSAGIASGSFRTGGMVICPCSMGTVAAIAHGTSQNLIHRAADVHLKERRKLILVARETPLSLIHINNMKTVTEAGGIICPATPSFYSRPETMDQLVATVTNRALSLAGLKIDGFSWGAK